MKHNQENGKKRIGTILLAVLLTLLCSLSALAAVKEPAKVKKLKAAAKNEAVTLSWSKVNGVDGYHVYQKDEKSGKFLRIQVVPTANTTSTGVKNLKNGKTYAFRVSAFRYADAKKERKVFGLRSDVVKVAPQKPALDTPVLKWVIEGNKSVKLRWEKVKGAKNYDVKLVRKDTGKKTWPAQNQRKSTLEIQKLKNDVTYKIAVRANAVVNGKKIHSEWMSVEAKPYDPEKRKTLLNQINHTSAYAGGIEPRLVYSDEVAESFANYGNNGGPFNSKTDYFLWLNTHGLHLYIFKRAAGNQWKVLYKFPCAIGRPSNQTPSGLWTLETKMYKDDHGSFYVLYCTFFTGYDTNSIHSQCYPVQQDPLVEGYFGSAGCVRCDLKYSKFVYDNCEGSPFLVR